MEHHVYAVWDFMSLLKHLQLSLTCVTIPWFPVGSANTRFFINEIVNGEESDVDEAGNRKSHFELYLDAMEQCGANTSGINTFIETLKNTGNLDSAFTAAETPLAAREFVSTTFDIINSGSLAAATSAFTFGREDLIPGMFISMVKDLAHKFPTQVATYKYYLERHIEVDGDHHGQLALAMTEEIFGDEVQKWKEAEAAAKTCLESRIQLWNAVELLTN